MPRREFATAKELHDYAEQTGQVCRVGDVAERQQQLSPGQYEMVDVHTLDGVKQAILIPKKVLKALWAAERRMWGLD
jgi:hypothetical protein